MKSFYCELQIIYRIHITLLNKYFTFLVLSNVLMRMTIIVGIRANTYYTVLQGLYLIDGCHHMISGKTAFYVYN